MAKEHPIIGLLPDYEIKRLCTPKDWPGTPLISPFVDHKEGNPSYGLEPTGYTLRLDKTYKKQTSEHAKLWGGIRTDDQWSEPIVADKWIEIPPLRSALLGAVEMIHMPDDVSAACLGKSTYARMGLTLNTTQIEPGWKGILTMEVFNTSDRKTLMLRVGQGIGQLWFFRTPKPDKAYEGLYQMAMQVLTPR